VTEYKIPLTLKMSSRPAYRPGK